MDDVPDGRLTYEQALRTIGRQLDVEPAFQLSVREDPDGFAVSCLPTESRPDAKSSQYSWARLHDLYVFHLSGRGGARKRHRHSGIWGKIPGGHEDFFRAVGYHMDFRGASSVQVEEMQDGISLSYRLSEAEGGKTVKAELGEAEIQEMLKEARDRRGSTLASASISS